MSTLPRIASFACVVLPLLLAGRARAQVNPWEFEVYPYATQGRGILELETDNAVVLAGHHGEGGTANGTFQSHHMWYNQYEVTYGLTDRIEAATYLWLALPAGHGYQFAGSALRLRGRLFDPDVLPVDLGWYAEVEWHKTPEFDDASTELEVRPIIEKDAGRLAFLVQPIFEKVLKGEGADEGFEFGYAGGARYRWRRSVSAGVELYGGVGLLSHLDPVRDQQHYVAPVVWGEFAHGIEYSVGPVFGLTRGSDRVLIKVNLELERFVGAILGPSPGSGWLF